MARTMHRKGGRNLQQKKKKKKSTNQPVQPFWGNPLKGQVEERRTIDIKDPAQNKKGKATLLRRHQEGTSPLALNEKDLSTRKEVMVRLNHEKSGC